MTHLTQDEAELVARLRYRVNNPSAWSEFEQAGSDLVSEAALAISRIAEERARCHERLEIDHYWKIGDNDDSDLERVEIPMDERASFPDGITARDATIALMQEELTAAEAALSQMKEALRVARPYVEQAVNDDGGIDNCEIGDRLVLERIGAALAQQPDKEGI